MTSSPYQSNLLRFFVRQCRQGMNRHRLAVRKTRLSVALGRELGVVVAVTPVYALFRTAQDIGKRAGKVLKQAVDKLQLSPVQLEAVELTKLVDLSNFARLPVGRGDAEKNQNAEGGVNPNLVSDNLIDRVNNHSVLVRSEAMMVEVLVTVGEKLLIRQRRQLLGQLSWWQFFGAKTSGFIKRLIVRSHQLDNVASDQLPSVQEIAGKDLLSAKSQKITGIASDISTKSLVLVLGNITVWNGLSAEQQKCIQDKIDTFLGVCDASPQVSSCDSRSRLVPNTVADTRLGIPQAKTAQIVSKTSQAALSIAKDVLVQPVRSFWIAVLQVMSEWFCCGKNVACPRHLTPECLKLPTLSFLVGRSVDSLPSDSLSSLQYILPISCRYVSPLPQHVYSVQTATLSTTTGDTSSYLDATVISVDYIEHPLEKFLKWVDRCLVQIETWWQRFVGLRRHWYKKALEENR